MRSFLLALLKKKQGKYSGYNFLNCDKTVNNCEKHFFHISKAKISSLSFSSLECGTQEGTRTFAFPQKKRKIKINLYIYY